MAVGSVQNKSANAENIAYDNTSTSSVITGDNVQEAIDQLFTSVSNGKSEIASAITDKGVNTSADASFAVMAENIGKISTGFTVTHEQINISLGQKAKPGRVLWQNMFVFINNIYIQTYDAAGAGDLISSINYNSSNGQITVNINDTSGVMFTNYATILTIYYID